MGFKRIEVTDQNGHKTEFLKDIDTGQLYKRTGLVPRDFPGCQIVEEEVEQEPCEDVVSRQAVLKQLKGCLLGGETEYKYVKLHIDSIPSVTPQQKTGHWIPCGERLPEKNGQYLVTVKTGYMLLGLWCGIKEDWRNVIAWMPLPQPYKESEE